MHDAAVGVPEKNERLNKLILLMYLGMQFVLAICGWAFQAPKKGGGNMQLMIHLVNLIHYTIFVKYTNFVLEITTF